MKLELNELENLMSFANKLVEIMMAQWGFMEERNIKA